MPHVAGAGKRRSWTRHGASLLDTAAKDCVSACCGHGGAAQTAVIAGLGRRWRAMRRASSGRCPRVRGHQNAAGRSRGGWGSGQRMMAFKRVRGCCGRVVEAGEGCVVRREASVPRHVNARAQCAPKARFSAAGRPALVLVAMSWFLYHSTANSQSLHCQTSAAACRRHTAAPAR
jgi:hypothetical protein